MTEQMTQISLKRPPFNFNLDADYTMCTVIICTAVYNAGFAVSCENWKDQSDDSLLNLLKQYFVIQ